MQVQCRRGPEALSLLAGQEGYRKAMGKKRLLLSLTQHTFVHFWCIVVTGDAGFEARLAATLYITAHRT